MKAPPHRHPRIRRKLRIPLMVISQNTQPRCGTGVAASVSVRSSRLSPPSANDTGACNLSSRHTLFKGQQCQLRVVSDLQIRQPNVFPGQHFRRGNVSVTSVSSEGRRHRMPRADFGDVVVKRRSIAHSHPPSGAISVGAAPIIAIPIAAFMRSRAVNLGRTPLTCCNDLGHSLLMIAIPGMDDCGLLHVRFCAGRA